MPAAKNFILLNTSCNGKVDISSSGDPGGVGGRGGKKLEARDGDGPFRKPANGPTAWGKVERPLPQRRQQVQAAVKEAESKYLDTLEDMKKDAYTELGPVKNATLRALQEAEARMQSLRSELKQIDDDIIEVTTRYYDLTVPERE